jgi:hypothetical protein
MIMIMITCMAEAQMDQFSSDQLRALALRQTQSLLWGEYLRDATQF